MRRYISPYFTLLFVVLISTIAVWLPFLLHASSWIGIKIANSSLLYIFGSYDGPLYVIPAKTLYDPQQIDIPNKGLIISFPLSPGYFAAHLPLYPLLIRLFSFIGYLRSMVFVNILSTTALVLFFFYMLQKLKLSAKPLYLAVILLFLPRFLVVRSVGAPESMFLFFVLVSLFFFETKRYVLAGIAGGLATMTKSPGMLLFFAYGLVFLEELWRTKKIPWRGWGIIFIPLGLLAVFSLYAVQYKDFFAYFHSGDNIHLLFPYAAFNFQAPWVGTAWLEDILFYFFIYGLTVITLKDSKHRSFFYFSLVFLTATIFVQHRDIARYSLPLWPLALIAFEKFLTSKKMLLLFLILLPAIYFYAWDFIVYNMMPISDWSPFM